MVYLLRTTYELTRSSRGCFLGRLNTVQTPLSEKCDGALEGTIEAYYSRYAITPYIIIKGRESAAQR